MSNDYYSASGSPGTQSSGSSSNMRSEFLLLQAGFDKLPVLSGNGTWIVTVNAGATALESISPAALLAAISGQPLDSDLTAIAALDATAGYLAKTGDATYARRTLTGTANEITITHGDGTSGNPVVSLPAALTFTGKTVTGGTFSVGTLSATSLTLSGALAGTTGTFSGTLTPQALLDISGASSGQIKFPATQNPSANANTLDDYEEGTWTPIDASGAALTLSSVGGTYTKIGDTVIAQGVWQYPINADGSTAIIGGLPFVSNSAQSARQAQISYSNGSLTLLALGNGGTSTFNLFSAPGGSVVLNSDLTNVSNWAQLIYKV